MKVASTAKRNFDHQCKKTFATKSAISRHCALSLNYFVSTQQNEAGIAGLIYEGLRWGCPRASTLSRLRLEIAGVMALVQLFFRRPVGAVDHSPALDGRALADFFCPAREVFIFARLQKLARVVIGGAVQHAVAVPRPDRHIGNRIFVAGDELIVRKLPVEHVELAFQLHCKTVDGVFDLHRSIGIEMPEAATEIGR